MEKPLPPKNTGTASPCGTLAPARLVRHFGGGFMLNLMGFSSDGKRVFSGSGYGDLRAWDVSSGQEVYLRPKALYYDTVLSADGKLIASIGVKTRLFEPDTGKELATLEATAGGHALRSAVLSPNGRLLLLERTERVPKNGETVPQFTRELWDVTTDRKLHVLGEGQTLPTSAAFTRDSQLVATGRDAGSICLWDAASGKEVRRFQGPAGRVMGLVFTRDGRLLLSVTTKAPVCVWDVSTGRELRRLGDGSDYLALSPDDKVVARTREQTIRLWDLGTGK